MYLRVRQAYTCYLSGMKRLKTYGGSIASEGMVSKLKLLLIPPWTKPLARSHLAISEENLTNRMPTCSATR
jgi:hypothetical protein